MNVSAFSRHIGLNQKSVDQYLKGERKPSAEFIFSVCSSYRVSSDWLLGLTETTPAPSIHATSGAAVASQSPGAKVSAALPSHEYSIDTMAIIRGQQEIIDHQKAQIATLERQLKKHGNKP